MKVVGLQEVQRDLEDAGKKFKRTQKDLAETLGKSCSDKVKVAMRNKVGRYSTGTMAANFGYFTNEGQGRSAEATPIWDYSEENDKWSLLFGERSEYIVIWEQGKSAYTVSTPNVMAIPESQIAAPYNVINGFVFTHHFAHPGWRGTGAIMKAVEDWIARDVDSILETYINDVI
jgi:hypothetical protein